MFSGGLDSILAVRIMQNEGFDVAAIHFYTGFNGNIATDIARGPSGRWEPEEHVVKAAESLGVELIPLDIREGFADVMLNPRYGYGSAANPCIDCRIFTLIHARKIMEDRNAALVFTGEVLGQRPMSQNRTMLITVEKRSSLEGRLLRPLSARLLDPTIPEMEGIVDREHMYDIQGRSRKRQIELAQTFGVEAYPTPAGGCILTDRQYGVKFKDLLAHADAHPVTLTDLLSIKTGRHIRLASGVKAVVGRREDENDYLDGLLDGCWQFTARDFPGATVFALDEPEDDDFSLLAAIAARYGKGSGELSVTVTARKGGDVREFTVKPVTQNDIDPLLLNP